MERIQTNPEYPLSSIKRLWRKKRLSTIVSPTDIITLSELQFIWIRTYVSVF